VLEDGLVGPERMGVVVAVDESADRRQQVAAGTAHPLGEDPRRHAQVVAVAARTRPRGLPGEAPQLAHLVAEHELDRLQEARRVDGDGVGGAAPPDPFPVVQARGHDREMGQVDDGAGAVGVEQRRGAGGADLGVVLLGLVLAEVVGVAEGVDADPLVEVGCARAVLVDVLVLAHRSS
jgi:hypothetical protein